MDQHYAKTEAEVGETEAVDLDTADRNMAILAAERSKRIDFFYHVNVITSGEDQSSCIVSL